MLAADDERESTKRKTIQFAFYYANRVPLTASASALAGDPAPGRGGARGAGVGAPPPAPGREGTGGFEPIFGLAGTTGLGPGAGGVRLAAGTGPDEEAGRGEGEGAADPPLAPAVAAAAAALRASS